MTVSIPIRSATQFYDMLSVTNKPFMLIVVMLDPLSDPSFSSFCSFIFKI